MPMGNILRAAVLLGALAAINPAGAQDPSQVGNVERAKNTVTAKPPGETDAARALSAGNPVFQNEMVSTGARARAELRLNDDTSLVLGDNAGVLLDEFIYDRDGSASINLVTGALRFVSGKREHPGNLVIKTAVATIGVRGTDFWVGPIDGVYGVLLLSGKVDVSNAGGSVTLDTPRTGTLITGADVAPGNPAPWPDDRRVRALSATDF